MKHEGKSGFPLLRKFYGRRYVNFYAREYNRGNVWKDGRKRKIKRGSTFTFARDLPYIASILFTRV